MSPKPSADDIIKKERILNWAGPAFPLDIREEAVQVYNDFIKGKSSESVEFFIQDLEFGTGGLRGLIGSGPGRMNRWTVGRAAAAFSEYLKQSFPEPSIVIAYDSRRMSREFGEITAGVAAAMGLRVWLFDQVTPTPVLSYSIRKLKASGGVVITASHNPPEYNGFKTYLSDGSQMVGEAQTFVEKQITALSDWGKIVFSEPDSDVYRKNVSLIGEEIRIAYYSEFDSVSFGKKFSRPVKIVYSPLHGTGGTWLTGLLEKYGAEVKLVPEQAEPDGEFPTVKYPNPEEPEAMVLAEEYARKEGADLFLATDPDADRMGAGVKAQDGSYVLLNGNQIGSIMAAYLAEKAASARSEIRWNIVKTIVTSELQSEIALKNGIRMHNVLTGFKYVAEKMKQMENGETGFDSSHDRFLFGGEESYGYLPVEFVRDKDSLSSSLLLCRILVEKGDLLKYLDEIYLNYGLYMELLKSLTLKGLDGQKKIREAIDNLRNNSLIGTTLGGRKVTGMLDYKFQKAYGNGDPDVFKNLPESNVLQFLLEPEGVLTIRPSGTEPKVKLYASLRSPVAPKSLEALTAAKAELQNELASLAGLFFAKAHLS